MCSENVLRPKISRSKRSQAIRSESQEKTFHSILCAASPCVSQQQLFRRSVSRANTPSETKNIIPFARSTALHGSAARSPSKCAASERKTRGHFLTQSRSSASPPPERQALRFLFRYFEIGRTCRPINVSIKSELMILNWAEENIEPLCRRFIATIVYMIAHRVYASERPK